MNRSLALERSHKALLVAATVIVKAFLMGIVASQVFCGSIDPSNFFLQECNNYLYLDLSIAAVALLGIGFGYFIIRIKAFDSIFAKMMRTDFFVTSMYFSVAFIAPSFVAPKVMIWLFGIWIFGMLLAPLNKDRIIWKKVIEYGGLVALGAILALHFSPLPQDAQQPLTLGMMVGSILSVFGSGRH